MIPEDQNIQYWCCENLRPCTIHSPNSISYDWCSVLKSTVIQRTQKVYDVCCYFNLQFLLLTLSPFQQFYLIHKDHDSPIPSCCFNNCDRHFSVSVYCTRSKLNPYRQVCEVALASSTRVLHGIHNLRCFAQLLAPLTSSSEAATQLWLVRTWRQNNYTIVTFNCSTVSQFMILNVEDFAITEMETAGSLPINWLWQNIVVYFILTAI